MPGAPRGYAEVSVGGSAIAVAVPLDSRGVVAARNLEEADTTLYAVNDKISAEFILLLKGGSVIEATAVNIQNQSSVFKH